MSNRVELNGQELEQVVGGAFHYNSNSDGTMSCRVDGYGSYPGGTYNCSATAKNMISVYILKNNPESLEDIINYALQAGLFWK